MGQYNSCTVKDFLPLPVSEIFHEKHKKPKLKVERLFRVYFAGWEVRWGEANQGKARRKTEKFHNEFRVRNYMFERL